MLRSSSGENLNVLNISGKGRGVLRKLYETESHPALVPLRNRWTHFSKFSAKFSSSTSAPESLNVSIFLLWHHAIFTRRVQSAP